MTSSDRLAAYIDSELSYEWQRKGSMETRAFAIVTADLAIAALFFAVADQLELLPGLNESPSAGLKVIALAAAAASILFSVLAAIPMSFNAPDIKVLEENCAQVRSIPEADVIEDLLRTRLGQLKSARHSNSAKAVLTILGFAGLAVSAGSLTGALLLA